VLTGQQEYELHYHLGHPEVQKTVHDMKDRFVIQGVRSLVEQVLKRCQVCQANQPPNWSKVGPWSSVPVAPHRGQCISMDLVDICPSKLSDGRPVDGAFVIVDRHSGWVDAYPILKKGLTSKSVALLMHEHWLPTMGVPQEVCSDLGPHFAGQWFKTFCALKGILHAEAVSYRSATNYRAERAIASVLGALRKLQNERNIPWPQALPQALTLVRSAPGSTGLSPAQVVFGRDVLQQGLPLPVEKMAEDAEAFHQRMEEVDAAVQQQLTKAHAEQEQNHHKGKI